MKHLKNFAQWLFLGVVLIAFVLLLRGFVPGQAKNKLPSEPLTSATPNPYPPPITSTPAPVLTQSPTQTIAPTPIAYPACQFSVKIPSEVVPVSNLGKFKISVPQIVRANEMMFGILDWTPDSSNLIYSTLHTKSSDATQSIELLNIKDNTSIVYGKAIDFWGFNSHGYAVWMESIQAVIFVQSAGNNNNFLTVSNPYMQKLIPSAIVGVNFARDADGNLLYFPSDDHSKLVAFDVQKDTEVLIAQDAVFHTSFSGLFWKQLKISPRPKTYQWLFYNDAGAFLLESQSRQVCEIDLGSRGKEKLWAEQIQWSPDGRFLTAIVTIGQPTVPFLDLVVIDTWTSKRWTLDLSGKPIYALSWSPNSRNLVVIAGTLRGFSNNPHELYLIDALTVSSLRLFRDYPFGLGTGFSGISWAPNGKIIAMDCKINIPGTSESRGQLCLISIEGD